MLYLLMVVTALVLCGVFKWNLWVAALVSVMAWTVLGTLLGRKPDGQK